MNRNKMLDYNNNGCFYYIIILLLVSTRLISEFEGDQEIPRYSKGAAFD